MDIYEYIGGQIRRLREESRLSQEALASQLGVSTNTVSRWETSIYKPSLGDLQKLAEFFHVRLSALLPPEEKEQSIHKALLSATGDLPEDDIKELIEYAEFRRARHLVPKGKKK